MCACAVAWYVLDVRSRMVDSFGCFVEEELAREGQELWSLYIFGEPQCWE